MAHAGEAGDLPGGGDRRPPGERHNSDHRGARGALSRPATVPADPEERRRALELEDWFDRELGPPIRQLVWHEYGQDQDQLMAVSASQAPEWMNAGIARLPGRAAVGAKRAGTAYARAFTVLRYRAANSGDAERSREAVLGALDRLEAELSGRQYLVGDRFSVADLTAASLLYALALPPGAPVGPELMPESFNRFREDLADRPGYRWIEEMYRRHRARPDA